MVGLAGEGANFDGNGSYIRAALGGGAAARSTSADRDCGTRRRRQREPRAARDKPAVSDEARRRTELERPCYRQPLPDVNGPQAGPGSAPASTLAPTPAAAAGSEIDHGHDHATTATAASTPRRRRREERDPQAPARLHRDHRARPDRRLRRPSTCSRTSARRCPGWVPIVGKRRLRAQGRVRDRAGDHAGARADGQHRRRRGRADRAASTSSTGARS